MARELASSRASPKTPKLRSSSSSELWNARFERVSVGKCHVQTANDRFGPGAKDAVRDRERSLFGMQPLQAQVPATWPGQDLHGADDPDTRNPDGTLYTLIPATQTYRNNLTALSQTYNLYLAAYQGRIFVYRPRSALTQALPARPDVQLIPRQSGWGRHNGMLHQGEEHNINHIITGFLGDEEIVLCCHDDGDVAAYYLKDVVKVLSELPTQSRERDLNAQAPKYPSPPFFHENVGKTAWGLAIHAKSRLIAVSSNRREVTVFAPALRHGSVAHLPNALDDPRVLKEQVLTRARNWRIMLLLGSRADNVPNISFMDGSDGEAQKICAIDIRRTVWLLDIFRPFQPAVAVEAPKLGTLLMSEEEYPSSSRGWGVTALPEDAFMEVDSVRELLGTSQPTTAIVPSSEKSRQPIAIIRKGLQEIPDDPLEAFRSRNARTNVANYIGFNDFDVSEEFAEHEMQLNTAEDLLAAVVEEGWGAESETPEEPDNLAAAQGLEQTGEESDSDGSEYSDEPQGPAQLADAPGADESLLLSVPQFVAEALEEAEAEGGLNGAADSEEDALPPTQPNNPPFLSPPYQTVENYDEAQYLLNLNLASQEQPMINQNAQGYLPTQGTPPPPPEPFNPPVGQLVPAAVLEDIAQQQLQQMEQMLDMQLNTPSATNASPEAPQLPMPLAPALPAIWHQQDPRSRFYGPNQDPRHMLESLSAFLSRIKAARHARRRDGILGPQDMIYFPHDGQMYLVPGNPMTYGSFLKRPMAINSNAQPSKWSNTGYHLLRTYEKDIELLNLWPEDQGGRSEIGIITPDAVPFGLFRDDRLARFFRATSRLNMILHVPALHLVIVGSPTGRVILLTLTRMRASKPPVRNKQGEWRHGYRVEWVLPRKSDEAEFRSVVRPLHGIAVGPVPTSSCDGWEIDRKGKGKGPARYRLMLHYRTHDIMTYEITREEETGKINIF